jgi:hypothetical protein
MSKIISIHHYRLKEDVSTQDFMGVIKRALKQRLFDLPGLEQFQFMRGIKGERRGMWSAIWIYSSQRAWETLWGKPTKPKKKSEYPQPWIRWEDELLAPLLEQDPDRITLTAYEEMISSTTLLENP